MASSIPDSEHAAEEHDEPPAEHAFFPETHEQALCWLAALGAARFTYRLVNAGENWRILVPAAQGEAACRELETYRKLNQDWPPPPLPLPNGTSQSSFTSLGIAIGLLLFYAFIGPFDSKSTFGSRGCADSVKILAGQWWRAGTALTLHASLSHVLGNAVCGLFFGQALSRQLGPGLGWFLILLSGLAGNLLAAGAADSPRVAIGASTATFGALGLLASRQFIRQYRHHRDLRNIWSRAWIAAGAGIGILALLGTAPQADLSGHLYGFGAGCLLGAATCFFPRKPYSESLQLAFFLLFALTLALCWHLALS
jgi:membrane associated rhomboid family serine protease